MWAIPPLGAKWKCSDMQPASPVTLTGLPLIAPFDPDHSHYPAWYCTYNGGKMDGACHVAVTQLSGGDISGCFGGELQYCPYSYALNTIWDKTHNYGILDPYFHIAEQYGFANWMFQTHQGPSQEAHMFLFSGTSAPDYFNDPNSNCGSAYPDCWQWFAAENPAEETTGCATPGNPVAKELPPDGQNPLWQNGYAPPGHNAGYPCYTPFTMVNLLQPAGISWRYYAGNTSGTNQSYGIWRAPDMIQNICQATGDNCTYKGYETNVYTGNPGVVLQDLGAVQGKPCALQQVSWVVPDGNWSDHPGKGANDAGPSWVAAIVNAVGGYTNLGATLPNQCNYWQNTVVLVVWDDWGGFYDDVLPWNCFANGTCNGYPNGTAQQYVYGFRVPLLVVSPYVTLTNGQPGYISGACTPTSCEAAVPYVHDFGSILNFIEAVFGLGATGGIGGISYPYADWFAPDVYTSGNCTQSVYPYSLYDFFNFGQTARSFSVIQGAKYDTSCFLSPSSTECFGSNYPADPDDDAIDPQ